MKKTKSIQRTAINNFSGKLFLVIKVLYKKFFIKSTDEQKVIFIVGCQRSGKTLIVNLFGKDLNSRIYGETSSLTLKGSQRLRLKPYDEVQHAIQRVKIPLIVLESLVESQNILTLLRHFRDSKAIWLFRHYKDVAQSNLERFGINNGIKDLRSIVEMNPRNWRSEKVSNNTRNIILNFFSENMDPYDAAALFWFVRNMIFFENKLERNQSVIMCNYEELVIKPVEMMAKIYKFIDFKFPGGRIVSDVYQTSIGKGQNLILSAEVEKLCNDLYQRLYEVYKNQPFLKI